MVHNPGQGEPEAENVVPALCYTVVGRSGTVIAVTPYRWVALLVDLMDGVLEAR